MTALPRFVRLLLPLLLVLGVAVAPAAGQRTAPVSGDRLSGTVLPVTPRDGDLVISALKAWSWRVDDTQRLYLSGDVVISIDGDAFRAPAAALWLNRLPSDAGAITQIAIYFDDLKNPTRRSGTRTHGRELLVTASVRGRTTLDVALLEPSAPKGRLDILREGEARLALHRRRLLAPPLPDLSIQPRLERPTPPPPPFIPQPGGRVEEIARLPREIDLPEVAADRPWLRDPTGVLRFAFGAIRLETEADENVLLLTDGVVIEYVAGPRGDEDLSDLTIAADRAVVFTAPGSVEEMMSSNVDVSMVRGIYLEGNVAVDANDGDYHIRAPHVFYDFRTDQAVMVDAVLRTYDRDRRIPVYARARELRQTAANQWVGTGARVSTSEFRVPHLSLGADRITIERRPDEPGSTELETYFDAEDIRLRAGNVPFFGWPRFRGRIQDVPLRSISVGGSNSDGVQLETGWNLYALLGREAPAGVDATLKIDGYTKRGAALGIELDYDVGNATGALDLYGLYDTGEDRTATGLDVDPEREERGLALWQHDERLARDWRLQLQAAWISDPTYITSWREEDYYERRTYETSAYLKYQWDRHALTLLANWEPNDFIANGWLLASAPYRVEKVPEVTYRRYGDPWFDGDVVYSSDTRLSRQRFVLDDVTPRELGVRGRAFGIGDDARLSDELRAQGLSERFVSRFDTRHELTVPIDWGPVRIAPFATGRFTAYDEDLEAPDGDDDDTQRLYGAVGVRASTRIQRVDDSVENRLLDLHRLRHIIEPSVTVWYAYSDINSDELPIYDPDVESIGDGTAMRVGLRNTWQTQRGGPGRWRSVDVLTLDADVVLNSGDTNREAPVPQWFDAWPEYSQFGEHAVGRGIWQLSDTLFVAGEATWDLDEDRMGRSSFGVQLRHIPQLNTYVEYRSIEPSDSELIEVGWDYRLTPKYRVVLIPQWDLQRDEFRAANVRVIRTFPDFDLSVLMRYDQIRDETTVGASLGLVEF